MVSLGKKVALSAGSVKVGAAKSITPGEGFTTCGVNTWGVAGPPPGLNRPNAIATARPATHNTTNPATPNPMYISGDVPPAFFCAVGA